MLMLVVDRRWWQVVALLVLTVSYGHADDPEKDKSPPIRPPMTARFMEYSYEMPMRRATDSDDPPKPIVYMRYGNYDGTSKKPVEVRTFGIPMTSMRTPIPVFRQPLPFNPPIVGPEDPFEHDQFQRQPFSPFEWHQPSDFFENFDSRFEPNSARFGGFPRFNFPPRPHWPDFDGFFEAFEHDVAENNHKVYDEHRRSQFEEETGRRFHYTV